MTRAKIIEGLEAIAKSEWMFKHADYFQLVCKEALALIKGQEARVVTTADFENNPNLDDNYHLNVWEEYREQRKATKWDD